MKNMWRRVAALTLVFLLSAHFSARALYWEDDFPANDPENAYHMPKGCVFGSVWRGLKRSVGSLSNFLIYGGREPQDMGPSLNKSKKGLVILGCSLLGVAAGTVIGLATKEEGDDATVHMSMAAGLGFMGGVIVGVWVVPDSFSYDEQAVVPAGFSLARNRDVRVNAALWQREF